MKKKILSLTVVLCLISAVFPLQTTKVNAEGHFHCVCTSTTCSGEGHNPTQEWAKWAIDNDLPTTSGYYYLSNDVNLDFWDPYEADIHLCLNGHTITCEQ